VISISGLGQRDLNPEQDGVRIATMISIKLKDAGGRLEQSLIFVWVAA